MGYPLPKTGWDDSCAWVGECERVATGSLVRDKGTDLADREFLLLLLLGDINFVMWELCACFCFACI